MASASAGVQSRLAGLDWMIARDQLGTEDDKFGTKEPTGTLPEHGDVRRVAAQQGGMRVDPLQSSDDIKYAKALARTRLVRDVGVIQEPQRPETIVGSHNDGVRVPR
jgi:hypothetical protein